MRIHALALFAIAQAGCLDDEELLLSEVAAAESVWQWTDDIQISATTPKTLVQVGLAPFGSRLHMLATGTPAFSGQLHWSWFDGTSWSTRTLPQYAEWGPALANFGGRLVGVYHAAGQNRLLMTTSTNASTWSSPVTVGTALGTDTLLYAPALGVYGTTLLLGYCRRTASSDQIRIERLDPVTNTSTAVASYSTGGRCKHVNITPLSSNQIEIQWNEESGSTGTWYMKRVTGTGMPSSSWLPNTMTMKSRKPNSSVTCDGRTHFVHGGNSTPEQIWWSYRSGADWTTNVQVPNQLSGGGAALGCLNGTRAIMVHNNTFNTVWWSEFGP